jgi:hypothetical protein
MGVKALPGTREVGAPLHLPVPFILAVTIGPIVWVGLWAKHVIKQPSEVPEVS